MTLDVINPTTGKLLNRYTSMSRSRVNEILHTMAVVRHAWEQTAFQERRILMHRMAQLLRRDCEHYAALITQEMGKPITQSKQEIEKCAKLCEHYADHAEAYLQPESIKTEKIKSYQCYQPLGIIFAIMPWNFPFWQVLRFAVPNLMAGNAVVLKHAPNSTGAALAIDRLFEAVGFPAGLFRSLVIDIDLATMVIEHPLVRGVTLTGSERAGATVGAQAAKVLKKVVLELGGSDPYLVLEDADIELATEQCVLSRLSNAGQICIAAKRIIVVDAVREAFLDAVVAKVRRYQEGDPMLPETTLGPLAREDLRQKLHQQVQHSIAAGARCLLGGKIPEGNGFFYPATILVDIKKGMPAYEEELFGPVVAILAARDEAEAIAIANDSCYGLAAAVFTRDVIRGERIAKEALQAGTCVVNGLVSSDPRLPFGGIKHSGYGRELGAEGIREFMNVKTIVVT